jgi:hypothetical protein
MLAGDLDRCFEFPCKDVRHGGYCHPDLPARRDHVRVVMILGAPPSNQTKPLTAPGGSARSRAFQSFRDAGYDVTTMEDIRDLGVHVTPAVKCPKLGYGLKPETITNCSFLLDAELAMFPNIRSILLMGDTAIRAINEIAERRYGFPAIPTGSAHKVKGHEYRLGDISLFPSYPQTGRDISVENDHQEVIAVDIRNAIAIADESTTRPLQTGPHRERARSPESRPRDLQGRSVESSSA